MAEEEVAYGDQVNDLGDFYLFDLFTSLWIPCNHQNEEIRGGCLAVSFLPADQSHQRPAGWVFSGQLFYHVVVLS
jgi:hypothetical protein